VSAPAPGRYCLAVCYCGDCPHFVPLKRTTERDDLGHTTTSTEPADTAWADREDPTWIDKL
jgi:hypothetical protein